MSGELSQIFMYCLARVVEEIPFDEDSPESPPLYFLERLASWLDYIYSQVGTVASTRDQAQSLVRNLKTDVEWLQARSP